MLSRILISTVAASAFLCSAAVAKPAATIRIYENSAEMSASSMGSSSMGSSYSTGSSPSMGSSQTESGMSAGMSPGSDMGDTASPGTNDSMTGGAATAAIEGDLLDVAREAGQFTAFARALEAAGLTSALEGDQQLTVFAPTDAAFAELPSGTLDTLLEPANREQLVDILTYHILGAAVTSDQLAGRTVRAQTASGEAVTIDARSGILVNDATVTVPDLRADNGVLHGVNKVLMPSDAPAPAAGAP
jgi:uncharacterized surface protein with fasciclin (FAS1) repeats